MYTNTHYTVDCLSDAEVHLFNTIGLGMVYSREDCKGFDAELDHLMSLQLVSMDHAGAYLTADGKQIFSAIHPNRETLEILY